MQSAVSKLGDPLEPTTTMGPLVNKAALERVSKMIDRAKNEAELVVGGVRHGDQGCFIEPTVFLNPKKERRFILMRYLVLWLLSRPLRMRRMF